jgi:hypothetical protein
MRSARCSLGTQISDFGIKLHAESFSLNRCSHTWHLHIMLGVNYGPLIVSSSREVNNVATSSAECATERDCQRTRMFLDRGHRRAAVASAVYKLDAKSGVSMMHRCGRSCDSNNHASSPGRSHTNSLRQWRPICLNVRDKAENIERGKKETADGACSSRTAR